MVVELPIPESSQSYVEVSVLEAGHIVVPENLAVEGGLPTQDLLPSMAFLIHHLKSGKRMIFDLGIRKDWENFPPPVLQMVNSVFHVQIPVDIVDSLRRGGMEPQDIDIIVMSHMHFDHIGDPTLFPTAQFVVHEEAKQLLENDDSGAFPRDLLPESRTSFLPTDDWKPIGPFPKAHDFFGDGSVYLVDAPGHLPGHTNALVRTSADGSWLYLGGDSAHDVRLITGEKEICFFADVGGMTCMHRDVAKAKENINRIRQVKALDKVQVLLAHDLGWYNENRDKGVMFPGKIQPM